MNQDQTIEEMIKKHKTPYQEVAKEALMKWNNYSEQQAEEKISRQTIAELEEEVYAMGSMKYAVIAIAKEIDLTDDETIQFFEAVVHGPTDAEIFNTVTEKVRGLTEEKKLDILAEIHDGWVLDNSSMEIFEKKVSKGQTRQYSPIELIGWNEVRSDLIFLKPILESIGEKIDENTLEEAYRSRVKGYFEERDIEKVEDIKELIDEGKDYYGALSEELAERLKTVSTETADQIVDNWDKNDPKTYEIFKSYEEEKGKELELELDNNEEQ